jgi:diguanylate cyclase (GGDEF)-like protein
MPTSDNPSEKRRHNRRETSVEAVLTFGENASTQCAILDFCEQGLFLQLNQSSTMALQKNKNAKIYFSATTEAGKEYFQIEAQVARIAEDGIGVAFDNISDSMYNALMKTADAGTIAAYSKDPGVFLTSSSQEQFKEAFKQMLNKNLPKIIGKFFDYAEDELEKAPEFAQNFKDVAAQANLTSVLRLNKDSLIKGFCRAVSSDIDFTSDKDEQNEEDALQTNLSLVEKNTFEDWLSFSSLIRKINAQYKNQLYQLELKLSYVTCFPRYLIKNPIDPERLCECFRQEIAGIEESVAAKKMLYKAFQATLTDHLPLLYKAFDALLVEQGAPSDIAQDIVWKKNYPTNNKKNTNTSSDGFTSGHNLPTFDNTAYSYPESYNLFAPSAPQLRKSYNQPVTETASKLFNLINQGLGAAQTTASRLGQITGNETINQFSGSEYSADELLAALAKLQASKSVQQLPQNASSLLQEQLDESSASSEYFGSKAFSPADKTKLDVYDQLFQSLLSEVVLTPSIKSYLEGIKLPLMGLALQDSNFLDSETHPARNLLNQLSSLESAVSENRVIKNTKIKQILDQLMSRIAQGSINNPDIFAKANEELKEISVPIAKSKELNIRRVVEVYEGKQKLEQARQKVQREIDSRLADKAIPSVIQLLLDSGWQHLLVIAELNNDDSTAPVRYLEVLDELLVWYSHFGQLSDEQVSIIEMELEFINTALGSVCTNAFLHNKVIEELNVTLLGTGEPRIRKPVDSIVVERKASEAEAANEFITDSWLLQVDQFETGDWFTFSLEKEAFEPLKLVWIGETPPVYVFVNRDGYKKQEFTRNELSELLQSGAVTNIENLDEPLMNRATTTMLQQMQEKLIHSVSHDTVTNLPNRKRFINLLKEQISNFTDTTHVLCYLEIEDFRVITNVCGIIGGDQLLLQIAQLLSNDLGENGIVSRLGDKTFGILLKNCSANEGHETAKSIRNLINKANFVWDDKSYTISVSIGLVPIIEGLYNAEELLQKADSVTISAKRLGHNRIRIYEENDEGLKAQTDIHEWAGRIDRIFSENRLFARCQMIAPIDPEKNSHSHYEILLGVLDESGNIIAPDKFIPAVERCQRMPEIDQWVVKHVFAWIVQNRESFDKIGGFAINLSGQSLNSEEFLTFLKDRLSVSDVPTEKITFEVTETVASGSLVFTKRFIKEIKQFGCKFSLDDFGTGYSSYSYLKSLDVDYLKIDGSFIKDIANSPTDVVMVNSMNEIAHSLELETIAEYVENMNIHAILKELGVDYAQGYGVHKPMPLTKLADLLMTQPDPSPTISHNLSPDPNQDPDDPLANFFN